MHRQIPILALVLVSSCLAFAAGATQAAPTSWGGPGNDPGQFGSPFAIAAHGDRLYVADFDHDRIQVFERSGEFVIGWGARGVEPGHFRGPSGIAVDRGGMVYVADHFNRRIQKFGPDGEFLAAWAAGDARSAPIGVAVDGQGRVLTTDLESATVRVWSADGSPIATWGGPGSGAGELVEPWGIAVDEDGVALVADHGNHRIQRFSSEGVSLEGWGVPGTGAGRLFGPMGVAIGAGGAVLVTDLVGDRIQRFTPGGEPLSSWNGSESAEGLTAPGLAWLDGDVYLADAAHQRILRVPASSFEPAVRIPATLELAAIAPTPSRGPVVLRLAVPGRGTLTADIYGIDGRRVFSSPPSVCEPGEQLLRWSARLDDGRRAPAGVYFVHVRFDGGDRSFSRHGRIVVIP